MWTWIKFGNKELEEEEKNSEGKEEAEEEGPALKNSGIRSWKRAKKESTSK